MNGYTKLFGSILASTIWGETKETKVLWITMLAMADKNGEVAAATPGLATMARLTLEETEAALARLMAPDPYSRTKDFEGRRIEVIDGGWVILNHPKYRAKMNADDRREYQTEHKRQSRAARRQMTTSDDSGLQKTTRTTHTEAEAEAEADTKEKKTPAGSSSVDGKPKQRFEPPSLADIAAYCFSRKNNVDPTTFFAHYTANGWVQASGQKIKNWKAAVVTWEKNRVERKSVGGVASQPVQHQQAPTLTPPT